MCFCQAFGISFGHFAVQGKGRGIALQWRAVFRLKSDQHPMSRARPGAQAVNHARYHVHHFSFRHWARRIPLAAEYVQVSFRRKVDH